MQPLQLPLRIKAIDGGLIGTGIITHCTKPLQLQVSALHSESISFLDSHYQAPHDPGLSIDATS